ncbi:hypothetical protein RN001_012953 [Aquatica leii]|uniref:Uncharacterized protein n=1 Tax=Aquatica leii TaxID=1421715 RepID=A0AAN7P221_9COLE|nr:hypothetical protein RN001_012953 [Aquatica leii]
MTQEDLSVPADVAGKIEVHFGKEDETSDEEDNIPLSVIRKTLHSEGVRAKRRLEASLGNDLNQRSEILIKKMMTNYLLIVTILVFCNLVFSAPPLKKSDSREGNSRSFHYFDYFEPEGNFDLANDDYEFDNDISSRTLPSKTKYNNRLQQYNSPIYYIRLPPQPYMFVPNLGYVSQPPSPSLNQFLNVPVSFLANGKPSQIYQWNGGVNHYNTPPPPTTSKPVTDSTIHRLPGKFSFNGKPNDIYVLEDHYNSLYSDALQNFYP